MLSLKQLARPLVILVMGCGFAVNAQANPVIFTLTGDLEEVLAGNPFGLTACDEPGIACTDSISASGSFDDSVFTTGISGDIFTLTDLDIVVGSEIFTNAMEFFGGGEIVLNAGSFVSLDYTAMAGSNGAPYEFSSFNLTFDSTTQLNGVWDANSYTVIPVPAAVWLFGSGLIGLIGIARRKRAN